jgi:two-component system sensor histidine kinase RegB
MGTVFSNFLGQLVLLRWVAVAGQGIAVVIAIYYLRVPLDAVCLWSGVAALALFNLWATYRASGAHASTREALFHIAFDTAVLAWMIGWSGGAMNPFSSLFLLPVALVAVTFPARVVVATAAIAGAGYAVATWFGTPLPHIRTIFGTPFDMHLWGMSINFVVSGLVFAFFLARLATALRAREAEVARMRERYARNEGIVALATHAASVAHELNTPLATLTLLVEDQLVRWPNDAERQADLETMSELVDDCRDRVRELAAPASDGEDARVAIESVIERWQLLRPTVELEREGNITPAMTMRLDPGIGHLLQTLLNNAADASEAAGSERVALSIDIDARRIAASVRDFGNGFEEAHPLSAGELFHTTKADGLGIGLALSHATVERLGGILSMQPADGGGTRVMFELPLAQLGESGA